LSQTITESVFAAHVADDGNMGSLADGRYQKLKYPKEKKFLKSTVLNKMVSK
jgi:hypothetical protein